MPCVCNSPILPLWAGFLIQTLATQLHLFLSSHLSSISLFSTLLQLLLLLAAALQSLFFLLAIHKERHSYILNFDSDSRPLSTQFPTLPLRLPSGPRPWTRLLKSTSIQSPFARLAPHVSLLTDVCVAGTNSLSSGAPEHAPSVVPQRYLFPSPPPPAAHPKSTDEMCRRRGRSSAMPALPANKL